MPETRALPIAMEHREFTVKVDGEVVPREHQLLAVSVSQVANRIASARLVYLDGNASTSDFPLGDADILKPGKQIEISAGAGSAQDKLFAGIIVRQNFRVRESSAPQIVIECRHAATKLSVTRRNKSYFDQSDSEIIEALLGGMAGDIESTSLKHKQQVQFHTSDWDFVLSRAQANGQLVWAKEDKIVVKKPAVSGSPVCTLQFGSTLIEFDAEIDSRKQFTAVKSVSWDPAQQALVEVEAANPGFDGPGNFSADDLAGVAAEESFELRHASIVEGEAQAWADGEWLRSRVNKVSGRGKCEGIGSVHVGDIVKLEGVGARCNGNVFVTGVRQDYDLVQGWKTHLQFGGIEAAPAPEVSMPAAGGLLAAVSGLQVGIVISNEDPDGEHRVRVKLPLVADDEGIWARVASLDAGAERGFFYRPEIDDEVVVGFFDDDPRRPIILGMLHSSAKAAPFEGKDDNHEKGYVSREKMRIYFNDEKKVLTIDTAAGNSITLSEEDKSVIIADQNQNKITMNMEGITIETPKVLTLKAGMNLALEASTGMAMKGGTEMKLEAVSAELSGSATTTIKGGVVQIN